MTLFHSIILGLVEGFTEFLPISSTAHLILTGKILGLAQNEFNTFFEVFIQSGAILAVLLVFFKKIMVDQALIKKTFVSFIPTALIGFLLHDIIKTVFFDSLQLITFSLFFIGIIFLVIEKKVKNNHKTIKKMSYREAIIIGLFQSFAVVPGVSRAGIVIISMLLLGYKREDSVYYTFILAIPTILAASALDFIKLDWNILTIDKSILILAGTLVSFFSALICIKWFISYVENKTMKIFGLYRIALAVVILFFLLLK
ncbi:hypothetical protein A2957_01450 [Candidatus Roizmanbacteria bacterium RIFCSPLOWO2_01_FULL_38_11]|uniref:Undecaprenyl-diphosphatase n=1 Tax=Candidatus Roizmanbacteria bacterium RIFCSPLOWO2_01_FULL_38_11 TaxID=1802060 RepID=A0A1F7IPG8_9BACT|nr:MAG: hypothetical protein A2957_01450 [Candidatus Roizmanbacteria bacterium RIFCSPLOWO2_01_FULL_38_11]